MLLAIIHNNASFSGKSPLWKKVVLSYKIIHQHICLELFSLINSPWSVCYLWIIVKVDYYSHSDGTHSLQMIHWWASDGMLNFSKSEEPKSATSWMVSRCHCSHDNEANFITLKDSSPKNENSVIIYSPSSSSKPVWISLFCWTQRKIFWRMWETEQFWSTIDFHSIYFFLLWKSMVPQNSLITNFLQNIFLCVQQNKEIHTGLELLEGE